jgi:hypothetical protein
MWHLSHKVAILSDDRVLKVSLSVRKRRQLAIYQKPAALQSQDILPLMLFLMTQGGQQATLENLQALINL